MNAGKFWTDKEVEVLKQMADLGYSADDIKKVLKSRTRDGISNKASAIGISLSGKQPEIDFEAFQRFIKGGKRGSIGM
jgi:hypothetical protein